MKYISTFTWNIQESFTCILINSLCILGMVDTIFADVAQPDQARIVAINAHNFLKKGGHFVISIKVRIIMII